MLIRAALVAVAAVVVVSAAAAGTAQIPVVHDTVWFKSGRVARGLIVTENVAGYCTGPARSTPRGDAWRCYADAHWIDPCFSANPYGRVVVCPFDPWATTVRLVSLTRKLPRLVERRARLNAPWGIWTANAKRCVVAVSGATLTLAGQRVRYECAGSGFLVGYAEVRRSEWTIGYVPRYDLGNPRLHLRRMGITHIWR